MFINAVTANRKKSHVLINTDFIVSAEHILLFMDYEYRITTSDRRVFVVSDEAEKVKLREVMGLDRPRSAVRS